VKIFKKAAVREIEEEIGIEVNTSELAPRHHSSAYT
jgi:8-oxo-dGTP pyrophosphatase MutT (NUDIX family)